MQEFLLVLNIAAYLSLGYVVMIGLVWLITRSEPDLWIYRDWAMKPVVFVLAGFGIKLAVQASRPKVREAQKQEEAGEFIPAAGEPNRFNSARVAKEYLVGRIVAEAQREGAPLSEVERKMLYFSETGWTLPGILDVSAEFERDYDTDAYEKKIAGLVRALGERATDEDQESWDDAVIKLSAGDHYLLVLIDTANPPWEPLPLLGRLGKRLGPWIPLSQIRGKRPPGDLLRLIVFTLIFMALMMGVVVLSHRLGWAR
jgi:hypothetical protein